MLVRLKGIWTATNRLADGSKRHYFYAWKGGPRLRRSDGSPITSKDDPHLPRAFAAAREARKAVPAGTMKTLIVDFKASSAFTELSAKTQRDYGRYLDLFEVKFGTMPYKAVEHKFARGRFKKWRDDIAAKSGKRTADYAWTVLARVLSCAVDSGTIEVNRCERGGRLYANDRAEKVWTDADEQKFLDGAPEHLHLPLLMGLWTGQREADLLRVTWLQYDGKYIRLRQTKARGGKGKRVTIPIGAPLRERLDALKAKIMADNGGAPPDGTILRTLRGNRAWSEDGFRSSFFKALADIGIEDLTFHDTRGTAVTRLAIAGASVPEIATITGHSLKTVQEILDTHYLNRDARMAESAIAKLVLRRQLRSRWPGFVSRAKSSGSGAPTLSGPDSGAILAAQDEPDGA